MNPNVNRGWGNGFWRLFDFWIFVRGTARKEGLRYISSRVFWRFGEKRVRRRMTDVLFAFLAFPAQGIGGVR
jgi:hypothetical protein